MAYPRINPAKLFILPTLEKGRRYIAPKPEQINCLVIVCLNISVAQPRQALCGKKIRRTRP